MRALLPSRRRSRVLGAALVAVLALLLTRPGPAWGANRTIEVANTEDGSFSPSEVTIEAGDTVTWQWTANEAHSVRFPEHPDIPTEGAECVPNPLTGDSCEGHTYRVRFEEVGSYPFRDGATGSEGRVEVTEKSEAPPKPTPTPDPTSEPEPEPEPQPEPEPEPEPTSEPETEPEPEPSPEPTSEPPPPPPPPTAGTAAPPTVDEQSASPTEESADTPTVAGTDSPSPIPDPTFEDFPEPDDPTAGEGVDGEVALDLPDDGDDGTRTIWGVVGGVTLLGTLGAFGRRVLFSEPWDVA